MDAPEPRKSWSSNPRPAWIARRAPRSSTRSRPPRPPRAAGRFTCASRARSPATARRPRSPDEVGAPPGTAPSTATTAPRSRRPSASGRRSCSTRSRALAHHAPDRPRLPSPGARAPSRKALAGSRALPRAPPRGASARGRRRGVRDGWHRDRHGRRRPQFRGLRGRRGLVPAPGLGLGRTFTENPPHRERRGCHRRRPLRRMQADPRKLPRSQGNPNRPVRRRGRRVHPRPERVRHPTSPAMPSGTFPLFALGPSLDLRGELGNELSALVRLVGEWNVLRETSSEPSVTRPCSSAARR